LEAHFKAVAAATSLPVILYNHPGRTGVTIEPATMAALAKVSNIVAVKDSSGSLDLVTAYRKACPADFAIYSGDDPLTLHYLATGGHGVISVTGHIVAATLKNMIEAWLAGDHAEALRLHLETYDLSKALFCAPSPAPTKAALKYMGFDVGGVRLPLVEASEAELAPLMKALNGWVPV
jgi:4-hydroxy-tetrahydrodipicolinate synthase